MADRNQKTPARADKLLRYFCGPILEEEFRGDLHEDFEARLGRQGRFRASVWYWLEVITFCWKFHNRYVRESRYDNRTILFSYFKISFRKLWSQKLYGFINISGLAVGLACCLVLLVYVSYELSF